MAGHNISESGIVALKGYNIRTSRVAVSTQVAQSPSLLQERYQLLVLIYFHQVLHYTICEERVNRRVERSPKGLLREREYLQP